jgi:ornithine decarboxylase
MVPPPPSLKACPSQILPCPVFEGSEKRIEVTFAVSPSSPPEGLRALTRAQLDAMLDLASCEIVSHKFNTHFDAYVLSESSLFVFADRIVLKTCGTTRLLEAAPYMVELATSDELNMVPARVKYSRASYLFPENQPAPHSSFDEEAFILRQLFSPYLGPGSAHVLGDKFNGLEWHVFVAGSTPATPGIDALASSALPPIPSLRPLSPRHTVEVCMTGLAPSKAASFYRHQHSFVSTKHTTDVSGIASLLDQEDIDDYVFEPCGYSMNGIVSKDSDAFSTIHITPEDGFSYASFELCGYDVTDVDVDSLVTAVTDILEPSNVSVTLSVDGKLPDVWGSRRGFALPPFYHCVSASYQELTAGGSVAYFVLEHQPLLAAQAAEAEAKAAAKAAQEEKQEVVVDDGGRVDGATTPQLPEKQAGRDANAGSSAASSPLAAPPSPRAVLRDQQQQEQDQGGMLSRGGRNTNAAAAAGGGTIRHRFPSFSTATNSSVTSSLHEGTASLMSDSASEGSGGSAQCCAAAAAGTEGGAGSAFDDVITAFGAVKLASSDSATIDAQLEELVGKYDLDDTTYIIDLGVIKRLYGAWLINFPRIHPHYAVKCNPDTALLATLAALGCGFDCASDAELDMVLRLGVHPDRIVFANPCKRPRDCRHAQSNGVALTTFDTEAELIKVARWQPTAKTLLRIRADDPGARCQLGNKYGAEPEEWACLFKKAAELGVDVAGVAFHVGSGATNPAAFSYAVELARECWEAGLKAGFKMRVLDVGGGFSGGQFDGNGKINLGEVADALNAALDTHFPPADKQGERGGEEVTVIAEPGRYFAEFAATLAAPIIGRRIRIEGECAALGDAQSYDYWITDGLYGSMNCLLYDHAVLQARPMGGVVAGSQLVRSTVFGPTCDGLDTVFRDHPLPEMEVGQWLVFPSMGAYTLCGASKFNGINAVDVATYYVCSEDN